jgi:hypothetical protein
MGEEEFPEDFRVSFTHSIGMRNDKLYEWLTVGDQGWVGQPTMIYDILELAEPCFLCVLQDRNNVARTLFQS